MVSKYMDYMILLFIFLCLIITTCVEERIDLIQSWMRKIGYVYVLTAYRREPANRGFGADDFIGKRHHHAPHSLHTITTSVPFESFIR